MSMPKWVIKHREPKTEIKFIRGGYYKYRVSYKYNPEKKRTDKITGVLLGKITEEDGFVPSEKNTLRERLHQSPVDIKNFGLYHLFSTLLAEEIEQLYSFFSEDVCELLISFSMFRWGCHSPIKRVPSYYLHDYCSEVFKIKKVNDKLVSSMLKTVGERRTEVVEWMRQLLSKGEQPVHDFVMMDSTHIPSQSELLTVNAKGYNSDFDFDKQIRLMYLFSMDLKQPVYYRLINGNITDIRSMVLCVEEMKLDHVIYIADKGFYSKANTEMMQAEKLQYIIPLRRDSKLIDYGPLEQAQFKKGLSYFTYQERIIWYYQYSNESGSFITYLNEGLRAKEEADYIRRIETHPEKYTFEKFQKRLTGFGTLTITYHMDSPKSSEEIYLAYKQRNEIEITFYAYKNFLKADVMYMQNRYVIEGWLMANFLAMLAYHKLFRRLKEANKIKKYSPKDIIELSKSIYKLKMKDEWRLSEITKKNLTLFKEIGIDYLNQRS